MRKLPKMGGIKGKIVRPAAKTQRQKSPPTIHRVGTAADVQPVHKKGEY